MAIPTVSVVMPVFNGEAFLKEAIDSILNQTFADFEFIIIDDGSSDDTAAIITSYSDARIRLLSNESNCGLSFSLNRGIEAARGKYVARMDADDVALPHRFSTQIRFMDRNPSIGVLGSWCREFGASHGHVRRFPLSHNFILAGMCFNPQFAHPTVVLRTDVLFNNMPRFNRELFPVEDWDFWLQCAEHTKFANLPRVLLNYRVHSSSVTLRALSAGDRDNLLVRKAEAIFHRVLTPIGVDLSPNSLRVHSQIAFGTPLGAQELLEARTWLLELSRLNRSQHALPEPEFSISLARWWAGLCLQSRTNPLSRIVQFASFPRSASALLHVFRRRLAEALPIGMPT